jgi:predicted amidohydrolase YtcJ
MQSKLQGEIYIKNGSIVDFIEKIGYVKIINEGTELFFENAYVYPGFCDHHGHITGLGRSLSMISFADCKSAEECCEKAKNSNQIYNEWIIGYGWNHENWINKELPDKKIIDHYFPDNPAYFVRVDGHTAWVNSKALKIAGIGSNPKNPSGGKILLDDSDSPTGILIDNAMELVNSIIPKLTENNIKSFIVKAVDELLKYGITEVDDMDVDPGYLSIFKKLDDSKELKIKVNSYVKAQNDEYLKHNLIPEKFNNFNVKGIKFYSDGALGSYGAAMIKPYSDNKMNSGLLLITAKDLFEKCKKGINSGFSIATHAIGDLANRLVIDVYAKLLESYPDEMPKLRIEHAQIIHPDDLKKIKTLADLGKNIIASVQPIHCISDAKMARKRLGRRTSYSYPWKSLQDNGAILLFGSDFPIESSDPITGIHALLNRIPVSEKKRWYPGEILTLQDALKGYQPDFKHNQSKRMTLLSKNDLADFAILDKNLFSLESKNVRTAKVIATFVNGKKVY